MSYAMTPTVISGERRCHIASDAQSRGARRPAGRADVDNMADWKRAVREIDARSPARMRCRMLLSGTCDPRPSVTCPIRR